MVWSSRLLLAPRMLCCFITDMKCPWVSWLQDLHNLPRNLCLQPEARWDVGQVAAGAYLYQHLGAAQLLRIAAGDSKRVILLGQNTRWSICLMSTWLVKQGVFCFHTLLSSCLANSLKSIQEPSTQKKHNTQQQLHDLCFFVQESGRYEPQEAWSCRCFCQSWPHRCPGQGKPCADDRAEEADEGATQKWPCGVRLVTTALGIFSISFHHGAQLGRRGCKPPLMRQIVGDPSSPCDSSKLIPSKYQLLSIIQWNTESTKESLKTHQISRTPFYSSNESPLSSQLTTNP